MASPRMIGAGPMRIAAVSGFVALVAAQRLRELSLSRRNEQALRARGGFEAGRRHYPLLVAIHVVFLLALPAETLALGARSGPLWPVWAVLFAGAQVLRASVIRTLGRYWTVRVIVVPGMPRITSGPYRLFRHPNYVAVVAEFIGGGMMFGAWRTALVLSASYAAALALRIPSEERALSRAAGPDPSARGGVAKGGRRG